MTEKAYEENKIIDKTKFDKWLTDAGNSDSLDVPTKDIENELRILIGFARQAERKKHEVEIKVARECLRNNKLDFNFFDNTCTTGKKINCKNKSCSLNEV